MTRETRLRLLSLEKPRPIPFRANLWGLSFSLMKLLPARFMLDRAEERGELVPGGRIVETTSGTFGMALAMLAAVRDYRLTLVTADSLVDRAFKHRLTLLGAKVIVTDDPQSSGNQQARLERLNAILAEDGKAYWPNQYGSPDNPTSYAAVAQQIVREIGHVDRLVACVGSGGSLSGTARYLQLAYPDLETVAVDTQGSILFGQPPMPRRLRGMGNSIVPDNLQHDLIDHLHLVDADHAYRAMLALYRRHGVFAGPTSGAAYLVADWFARLEPDVRTVFLMADEGHRYPAAYKVRATTLEATSIETLSPGPVLIDTVSNASDAAWVRLAWGRRPLQTAMSRPRSSAMSD